MQMPGLDAIGRFTGRREMELVRSTLAAGEQVRQAVQGRVSRRHGLLVATDRRLVWVATGLVASRVVSWPYADVAALEVQVESPDAASIEVRPDGGTPFLVEAADKRDAEAFAAAIQRTAPDRRFRKVELVDEPRLASDPDEDLPPAERRLRQIDRMLAKGSMTPAEHKANRARLLAAAGLPEDLPPPGRARAPELAASGSAAPPWPGTKGDDKVRRYRL